MADRRAPLDSTFTVFVVPRSGVRSGGLTIPKVIGASAPSGLIPVAAEAGPTHVEAGFWAFATKRDRAKVVRQLRALADWLEQKT